MNEHELRGRLTVLEVRITATVLLVGALVLFATADRLIPLLVGWALLAAAAWARWQARQIEKETEARVHDPV